ncbi:Uncharacterised protein [uncultured archaeon]|nr:Uncharacterised protein [uncultured archaeon]
MISDDGDIAEYILNNYRNKVVEIGVGNLPQVAFLLKDKLDVTVTDINEQKHNGIRFYRDDIFNPDIGIYESASLMYSIRPPIDLQDAMAKTAWDVGADLIIRPFGNERADLRKYYKDYKLVNYKKARFYLYRFADITSS